jgi:hypothetical protein
LQYYWIPDFHIFSLLKYSRPWKDFLQVLICEEYLNGASMSVCLLRFLPKMVLGLLFFYHYCYFCLYCYVILSVTHWQLFLLYLHKSHSLPHKLLRIFCLQTLSMSHEPAISGTSPGKSSTWS